MIPADFISSTSTSLTDSAPTAPEESVTAEGDLARKQKKRDTAPPDILEPQDSLGLNTSNQKFSSVGLKHREAYPELSTGGKLDMLDEKTPLLNTATAKDGVKQHQKKPETFIRRIGSAIATTYKVIVDTILVAPRYAIACFYDEHGHFSALLPIYRIGRAVNPRRRRREAQAMAVPASTEKELRPSSRRKRKSDDQSGNEKPATADSEHLDFSPTSELNTIPETNSNEIRGNVDGEADHAARKRTPRIRLAPDGDDVRERRRSREPRDRQNQSTRPKTNEPPLTISTIKSPTAPPSSLLVTRYPRAPAPPRPLIPKRQPSYTSMNIPSSGSPQKTLIIDLDETLIHSMAKGGRMSTGHMVEVKLNQSVGAGGTTIAPQVPILYYVHKRPNCDEFLRKVSKWYKLVVFTASVQEYADPVINWLETERQYFAARFYRQHCTYRNGSYAKDLSQVEPDLSRVIILDNSPLSYVFHEDNAIPIEGWISDPTDNDLLHLIPLLEGLQYATDVRALLALRLGESTAR